MNLNNFEKFNDKDIIFIKKHPKQYLQVKSTLINNNSCMISIINDITRLKELELQAFKSRSLFFSSIAHELRTPLNSIIPIAKRLEERENDP